MLMGVLVLLALMMVALAVAAPKIAEDIRRDKELELSHRGKQYTRAIRLYYKKFNAYPTSMDQLVKTNEIRFLRKRYTDPLTGKDDWVIIHYGQAHVQSLGLFGQPLSSSTGTGAGGAPTGAPGTTPGGAAPSGSAFGGGNSPFGGSNSTFGGGDSSFGGGGSSFGGGSTIGAPNNGQAAGTTDPSAPAGAPGTAPGSAIGSGTGNGTGSPGGISATSPTLGSAGPIIGVKVPDTRASIKIYKKQKHYNEWEFVYDPMQDLSGGGSVLGGQSTSGTSPNTGFGSGSPGNTGIGPGGAGGAGGVGGFGSPSGPTTPAPTSPSQPTNPQ